MAQGGWLCSELDCNVVGPASSLMPREGQAHWFAVGDAITLALQAGRLVEYDMQTRCGQAPQVGFCRMNFSEQHAAAMCWKVLHAQALLNMLGEPLGTCGKFVPRRSSFMQSYWHA